ncbi:hypothetical protein JMJ77_0007854 [Colletotrichum scovillei]|uniref:Uncharacterized protein n=1 Tax=Colletotrichum scovillei TaxID=1209932 RepID=A0A9P7RFV0_9PEZI|nr:hypothetical protein JMJ77_0007854 [Colletotrichum scovillei]KAG7074864.1 hypothetical protein JMJ76_0011332 [Colletotrichum scovillei]KAG7081778.1 hypothetical protein JMJ78_0003892 [Colletotrichum scovillei]
MRRIKTACQVTSYPIGLYHKVVGTYQPFSVVTTSSITSVSSRRYPIQVTCLTSSSNEVLWYRIVRCR